MVFGIRDLANEIHALREVVKDLNQTERNNGVELARIAEAIEFRNRLEFERRWSPPDLGIIFKADDSSPARDRGDKVERNFR